MVCDSLFYPLISHVSFQEIYYYIYCQFKIHLIAMVAV